VYGAGLETWHYGQAVAAEEEDRQADNTQGKKVVFFTKSPSPKQRKHFAPMGCRMITKGGLGKDVGGNV